jgi:hypothetical protein
MKVRIALSVDIDPELWAEYAGSGDTAAEVREDVKAYALAQVQGAALIQDADGSVTPAN